MYIKRTIEQSILEYSGFFPVLLITGPRQVGKTTVLQKCCGNSRAYVSLDTLEHRNLAKNDPALFLQKFRWPVLIDEIQYAPELLPYIKAAADKENKPGMFWLTGSQQFHLMKNVSESLAGRAGILRLQGLSQDEQEKRNIVLPFLPDEEYINSKAVFNPQTSLILIYERIWKGSYPRL
ncbi:MAG: AAA family ATPase, partial [Elusimicrobiales bacterium]|nr:AAA family ATPase [Elusimicrobiales bacterium]